MTRKCRNCGQNWPRELEMTPAQRVARLRAVRVKIRKGEAFNAKVPFDDDGRLLDLRYTSIAELSKLVLKYDPPSP